MTRKTTRQSDFEDEDTRAITFNGRRVGHVDVEWIGLDASCDHHHAMDNDKTYDKTHTYRKAVYVIDSDDMMEDRNIKEAVFELDETFFKYSTLDYEGQILYTFTLPVKYLHVVRTSNRILEMPPMNKLFKEEKRDLK